MPSSEVMSTQVSRFRLQAADQRVFPVYWINTPDYANGFLKAKGSPKQMQEEVDRIVGLAAAEGEDPNIYDAGSAQNFLYRNNIGIDCSGFVFHLVSGIVGEKRLAKSLYVPKTKVIMAAQKEDWKDEHDLTKKEANELPPMVPLRWVCDTFNRQPQFQVNVASLSTDEASVQVDSLRDIRPGDLITMRQSEKSKHCVIVTDVDIKKKKGRIIVWDSYRENDGYGGVQPHKINVADFNEPIEHQQWSRFDTSRYDRYDIRRLRVLANR